MNSDTNPTLVIVTGLSGAGKSIAIKALEDISYFCVDNIPLDLIDQVADHFLKSKNLSNKFALGIDSRDPLIATRFSEIKERLSRKIDVKVVFLWCEEDVLASRYSATRRKHPLLDEGGELLAAIRRETSLMASVNDCADLKIDTSSFTPHQLARVIEEKFSKDGEGRSLHVTITSFGFKHGLLKPSDSIFDVRFLKNPYFIEGLKRKTGHDLEVREYIASDPNTDKFINHLVDLHTFLFPNYYMEGKHYFRLGIGCTGGQHRSVYIAELFAEIMSEKNLPNIVVSVSHRDLCLSER